MTESDAPESAKAAGSGGGIPQAQWVSCKPTVFAGREVHSH